MARRGQPVSATDSLPRKGRGDVALPGRRLHQRLRADHAGVAVEQALAVPFLDLAHAQHLGCNGFRRKNRSGALARGAGLD